MIEGERRQPITQGGKPRDRVDGILLLVARYYDVPPRKLLGPERSRKFSLPRSVLMYFLRRATNLSYPEIGNRIGGRHHTTAIYSVRKIGRLRLSDVKIEADVAYLEEALGVAWMTKSSPESLDSKSE